MTNGTRRLRYSVAMSLDGFIATEDGGYDWIPPADDIDFVAFLAGIDALVMGRGTYETMLAQDDALAAFKDQDIFVVSTTLTGEDHPQVTVLADGVSDVAELKRREGKDIWLFGGGVLFRSMLSAKLVDRVELAVIPRLLGSGIPVVPGVDEMAGLDLHSSEHFASGIVLLKYDVL